MKMIGSQYFTYPNIHIFFLQDTAEFEEVFRHVRWSLLSQYDHLKELAGQSARAQCPIFHSGVRSTSHIPSPSARSKSHFPFGCAFYVTYSIFERA